MSKPILHICPVKQLYSLAGRLENKKSVAAILCTTEMISKAKLEGISHIHVSFADVTDSHRYDAFKPEKAQRIKRFVDNLEGIDTLYICCDSGESRSTAVAAAILRYWGNDEMTIWRNVHYHPNRLVYYLQCKAFNYSVTKIRAFALSEYNKSLFRKQIRSQR